MKFHVLTLFPDMVEQGLHTSILGRAMERGCISLETTNIRDFSVNKHMRVDDYPYGGGAGMVLEAEPVYRACQSVEQKIGYRPRVVYLTPQGKTLCQNMVEDLAQEKDLVLLCGHYEGIDERVLEEVVTDYVSIGDYVLTGGELGAMVLIDAVSRFVPGVLSNEESAQFESFQDNLLEYPHYTRPEEWHGKKVPSVLLSGDHRKIETWRYQKSIERTRERRPDLMEKVRKLTAVYFSPTAGTKKAVEMLAENMSQHPEYLDLTRRKLRKKKYYFGSKDILVAAAPVYGGQLPQVEGLFRNLKGDHTPCIVMAAYGNRHYDDTLAQMRRILEEQGFCCVGGIACVIPHIFAEVGVGRPDQEDQKSFHAFAVEMKKRIEEGKSCPDLPGNPQPVKKEMQPMPKFFDEQKCTACQACMQGCPTGAISQDLHTINESLCINCMRCVKVCRFQARSFDASRIKSFLEEKCAEHRPVEWY